jgi:integrase
MAKTGENIYKRKDGRWEGRVLLGTNLAGNPRYRSFYAASYRDVKEKLKTYHRTGGQSDAPPSAADPSLTDWLEMWLLHKQPNIKPSSFIRYQMLCRKHIAERIGKTRLSRLKTAQLEAFRDNLLVDGQLHRKSGLAKSTASGICSLLRAALDTARNTGYSVNCHTGTLVIRKSRTEIRVFNKMEQVTLNNFLLADMNALKFGVYLCFYTGLRLGEICALRWWHIDVKGQTLRVRQTMQRLPILGNADVRTEIVTSAPKSPCATRDIPLADFLLSYTQHMRGQADGPDAYVLTGSQDHFVEPRCLQYFFKKWLVQLDVPHANFHAIRHTFATRCVEQGVELKSLSEILGHANVNVTLNRYVHTSFSWKKKQMDKLAGSEL